MEKDAGERAVLEMKSTYFLFFQVPSWKLASRFDKVSMLNKSRKKEKMADRISSLLWLLYCLFIVVPGYSLAQETENIPGGDIEKGNSTKETFNKDLSDFMGMYSGN